MSYYLHKCRESSAFSRPPVSYLHDSDVHLSQHICQTFWFNAARDSIWLSYEVKVSPQYGIGSD